MIKKFFDSLKEKDPRAVYYVMTFGSDFAIGLIFAIYVLFLMNRGLDLFQVNVVNFFFMAGTFICEIPTGVFADFFGRRKSVLLSTILVAIGLLVYFLSQNLWSFVVAELIIALATTFASGALDAWVVDAMQKPEYAGKADFVFSHGNIASRIAALVAGLAGAYLGTINLALPFLVGAIISAFAFVFGLFYLHEDFTKPKSKYSIKDTLDHTLQIAKDSIKYGMKKPPVFWLTVSSFVSMIAFMPLNMFWQPRFNELAGDQIWLLGWVWVGFSLMMILGSFFISKIQGKSSDLRMFFLTTVLMSVPILLIAKLNVFLPVFIGYLVHEAGRGMKAPVHKMFINRNIPSDKRATIISYDSAIENLGGATGLLLLGWVGKNYSISSAWLISGGLLLLLLPIYRKACHADGAVPKIS